MKEITFQEKSRNGGGIKFIGVQVANLLPEMDFCFRNSTLIPLTKSGSLFYRRTMFGGERKTANLFFDIAQGDYDS